MQSSAPPLLAVQVGNTRTQLGLFRQDELVENRRFANADLASIVDEAARLWESIRGEAQSAIALASVNDKVAKPLESMLEDQLGVEVYTIGDDLPVPIGESLDPETLVGADRLLNAAAAWDRLKQACVIVDAGTAVTVDFVDGEGTFHGGAIAPGASMQLKGLHEGTDALPAIAFRRPGDEAFGKNTADAMILGVFEGIRGLVWRLVERYSAANGAFPLVIATGGDAETLFADDELVNRIVPELTLQGIAVAARFALTDPEGDIHGGGARRGDGGDDTDEAD